MRKDHIDKLMALDWVVEIAPDPDGGFVLTVEGLDDFAAYGKSKADVLGQFEDALRSHLAGYLSIGKVVPVPVAGKVVQEQQYTGGQGEWAHIGFNAATGKLRTGSAPA